MSNGEEQKEMFRRMYQWGWRIVLDPLWRDDGSITWDAWIVAPTGERLYESSDTYPEPALALAVALLAAAEKVSAIEQEKV